MTSPVVHISRLGNLGNQMFQLMAARSIARRVPGCVISSQDMPSWGLGFGYVSAEGRRARTVTKHRIPIDELVSDLRDGKIDYVDLQSYAQHMDNLPDEMADYARDFKPRDNGAGGAEDELVINIRAGEVLDAPHPDYVVLPISFLKTIIASTNLKPVFCGQTEMNNRYLYELRAAFPDATFIPNPGPMETFDYMRHSKHLVPSVSTFSWLAAWFSDAANIFFPLIGFYNPFQCPAQNLVPLGDKRYRFYLFPANYAVNATHLAASHRKLNGQWRYFEHAVLHDYMKSAPRVPFRPASYFKFFDEDFYRLRYPDVAQSVTDGHIPDGRHHYEHFGVHEGREPFELDLPFYVRTYPMAALEIGQGDYLGPYHHYVESGFARGYRRKEEGLT